MVGQNVQLSKKYSIALAAMIFICTISACEDDDSVKPTEVPQESEDPKVEIVLDSIDQPILCGGQPITIYGRNFTTVPSEINLKISGHTTEVLTATENLLTAIIPDELTNGTVEVTHSKALNTGVLVYEFDTECDDEEDKYSKVIFESIEPLDACRNEPITIKGQNFDVLGWPTIAIGSSIQITLEVSPTEIVFVHTRPIGDGVIRVSDSPTDPLLPRVHLHTFPEPLSPKNACGDNFYFVIYNFAINISENPEQNANPAKVWQQGTFGVNPRSGNGEFVYRPEINTVTISDSFEQPRQDGLTDKHNVNVHFVFEGTENQLSSIVYENNTNTTIEYSTGEAPVEYASYFLKVTIDPNAMSQSGDRLIIEDDELCQNARTEFSGRQRESKEPNAQFVEQTFLSNHCVDNSEISIRYKTP